MKTKIAKWVIESTPDNITICGDLDYRGSDRKEDCELIDSFAWLRKNYPDFKYLAVHPENEMVTNGGTSYAQHAMSLKKGRVDGMCDFVMLSPTVNAPNLLIEFKRQNIANSLKTKQQKEHFIKQMNILNVQSATGAECYLCLSFDEFKKILKSYCNRFGV